MIYQLDNYGILKLQKFIGLHPDTLNYLHNTPTELNAQKIIQQGLSFKSHIDYTSDCINGDDDVDIKYFLNSRQNYGNYTIIVQIGLNLIDKYTKLIHNSAFHFSEVLINEIKFDNEENELIYFLHPNFTKGYFDIEKGISYLNPNFNPMMDLLIFKENLKRLLKT